MVFSFYGIESGRDVAERFWWCSSVPYLLDGGIAIAGRQSSLVPIRRVSP
ncbi:MAG: hypothetical protein WCA35_23240 [Kovacikia sp.]